MEARVVDDQLSQSASEEETSGVPAQGMKRKARKSGTDEDGEGYNASNSDNNMNPQRKKLVKKPNGSDDKKKSGASLESTENLDLIENDSASSEGGDKQGMTLA